MLAGQALSPSSRHAVLLVQLGGRRYGLRLADIERVLPMAAVVPLPDASQSLWGVLNVHGDVLPVVDPRPRLGLTTPTPHPDHRLVLLAGERRCLLWVDAVEEVATVDPEAISAVGDFGCAAPALVTDVVRLPDGLVPVLATDRFLPDASR